MRRSPMMMKRRGPMMMSPSGARITYHEMLGVGR